MVTQLTRKVGLPVWRGMIAVLFGLTALWSGAFLTTLVLGFGVYALADGLSALMASRLDRHRWDHGWALSLKGAMGAV
ncbi:MAG: DUF308 domain-containing protein [Anaerolineae bacterium]|nr:DUF308 domain-containing protein [Anaerolineae bacterium]